MINVEMINPTIHSSAVAVDRYIDFMPSLDEEECRTQRTNSSWELEINFDDEDEEVSERGDDSAHQEMIRPSSSSTYSTFSSHRSSRDTHPSSVHDSPHGSRPSSPTLPHTSTSKSPIVIDFAGRAGIATESDPDRDSGAEADDEKEGPGNRKTVFILPPTASTASFPLDAFPHPPLPGWTSRDTDRDTPDPHRGRDSVPVARTVSARRYSDPGVSRRNMYLLAKSKRLRRTISSDNIGLWGCSAPLEHHSSSSVAGPSPRNNVRNDRGSLVRNEVYTDTHTLPSFEVLSALIHQNKLRGDVRMCVEEQGSSGEGINITENSQQNLDQGPPDISPTLPLTTIPSIPIETSTCQLSSSPVLPALTPSSSSRLSLVEYPFILTPHRDANRPAGVSSTTTHSDRNSLSSCYSESSFANTSSSNLAHHHEEKEGKDPGLSSLTPAAQSSGHTTEIVVSSGSTTRANAGSNDPLSYTRRIPNNASALPPFASTSTATKGIVEANSSRPNTPPRATDNKHTMAFGSIRSRGTDWFTDGGVHDPPYGHEKTPSVPYSTRSTSTFSRPISPPTSHSRALSPPISFINLSTSTSTSNPTSRRASKFTAFSGGSSSASSIHSSEDSSLRNGHYPNHHLTSNGNGGHYHTAEAPDISTVYEEEGSSFDDHQSQSLHPHQRHHQSNFFPYPLAKGGLNGPCATGSPSLGFSPHFAPINNRSPPLPPTTTTNQYQQLLPPFTPENGQAASYSHLQHNRTGTVSSTTSGNSAKSYHPFATALIRPSSPAPPPLPTLSAQFSSLRGKGGKQILGALQASETSPTLSSSRSQPNLTVEYLKSSSGDMSGPRGIVSTEIVSEELCPICVLDLSFEYKMAGEKPNVVPVCGHAMHWECYQTAYNDRQGICGVCREPIVMGEGRSGKLDSLTGSAARGPSRPAHVAPLPPVSANSASSRFPSTEPDETGDDPVDSASIASSSRGQSNNGRATATKLTVPNITVKPEYPHLDPGRSRDGKPITSVMVTVQVPLAGERTYYSARQPKLQMSPKEERHSPILPPSPRSDSNSDAFAGPLSTRPEPSIPSPASFGPILADLARRVPGYDKMDLDHLGPLVLFDILTLTKSLQTREFYLYLFDSALVCVAEEEKKGGLRGLFSSNSSAKSSESGASSRKMALMVKGKVYAKDLRQIVDSSMTGEISLSITMHEPGDKLETFTIAFKDKSTQENWRSTLVRLRNKHSPEMRAIPPPPVSGNSASKIARLMGQEASKAVNSPMPMSATSQASSISRRGFSDLSQGLQTPHSATSLPSASSSRSLLEAQRGPGDLVYQRPIAPVHTPLDLIIVICVPHMAHPNATPSLKLRLVRQALATVMAVMGTKDRVSLVASEVGPTGKIRKTPYLNPTRYESRQKLESFISTLGQGQTEEVDEFEVRKNREERQGVVSAMNGALDNVLQRKTKNPLGGIIVISEIAETLGRGHMDLVKARLDAAGLPVHGIGYTKSHDPSALWVMTEHTKGTYTFVKDWMDLRQSLIGCVAGMMSIALTKLKIHLNCRDHDFRIKKVEGTQENFPISNGKDVDIDLFELRHGETRELIIQLEYDNPLLPLSPTDDLGRLAGGRASSVMTGRTGASLGLENMSMDERSPSLPDLAYEGNVIDEVPALQVDCSFSDPAMGRSVAHLNHPVLLTMAIMPATSLHGQPLSPLSDLPLHSSASIRSSSSGNNFAGPPGNGSNGRFAKPQIAGNPTIIRRRMELFASEMLTRALMIASRKNFATAINIAKSTKGVLQGVMDAWRAALPSEVLESRGLASMDNGDAASALSGNDGRRGSTRSNGHGNGKTVRPRAGREQEMLAGLERLAGPMSDVEYLLEGLEEQQDMFEKDQKRMAAQQAIVLRLQRAWTTKTTTEMTYCSEDVQETIEASNQFRPLV